MKKSLNWGMQFSVKNLIRLSLCVCVCMLCLTFTMQNSDIYCFENSIYPDQLAS